MQLENQTILVTGASSGIGRALVAKLAPVNRTVIALARRRDKLERLTEEYHNVVPWPCDLADPHSVDEQLGKLLDNYPDLSVVINNAGIQCTPLLHESDFCLESVEREMAINFAAPVRICARTIHHLLGRPRPAAYVNVTSGLGLFPKKRAAVYSATKAGLLTFSRALRYQLEGSPVAVHAAILPLVATPMTEGRGGRKITAERAAAEILIGVEDDRTEIYVGKARWMPVIAKLSPALMASIIRKTDG